tara:strand:- start:282 stop:506 length:225 start_codon:yes stop_codon:yes gene_type:complete
MYKIKTIYPLFQNKKLSKLWLDLWLIRKKFAFWLIFVPIAVLITFYYNTKKSLGLHNPKKIPFMLKNIIKEDEE